ncbi:GNAT family N-acetyltransferase [Natronolimnohabitans innermongolicus]|uniref:BioF2-like acetyltransferase domain-containing protein n=1 Tax=Natronolimnohabitans innermongolicus JCM 12255 TaxID=1227499 RepID=L9XG86_9EURY|nr:GNAT family N-acetyltransferase [Natronolimnohabitans innermongolicus]ELY60730.1 hypothetical protein C493_03467 [Natronolimnohabitans innermongolicus JCM 12255]
MRIEELTLEEWEDEFPADGFGVFHRPEALQVLEEYWSGRLLLYGGYRGEQLVGLMPLFVRTIAGVTAVLSPPPGFSVPRLGPILLPASPKPHKRERTNREFVEQVLEKVGADDPLTLVGTVATPAYADPRPFRWHGFDVEPRFTYSIDLADRDIDDVMMSFSKDLRTEIRDAQELPLTVSVADVDAAAFVYDRYQDRFEEQGLSMPTSRDFAIDLVHALGDHARVYVVEGPDGERLSGILVLYSDEVAYSWMGGTPAYYEGTSVNGLLEKHLMSDILTEPELESIVAYDLGNANKEQLVEQKSKYAPELVSHYELKSGPLMSVAKRVYQELTY